MQKIYSSMLRLGFTFYLFMGYLFMGLLNVQPAIAGDEPTKIETNIAEIVQPKVRVENALSEIVRIVEENSGDEKKIERRAKLRQVLEPVFDFNDMARRSLGPYWNEISIAEQEEFVSVFSELLAKTYLSKVETVKPGMIKVVNEKVSSPTVATVNTSVLNKGKSFPLNYKMHNTAGNWRVWDVVIENISLVDNYRNEFAGIVRKEKFSGLLQRLKNKKIN